MVGGRYFITWFLSCCFIFGGIIQSAPEKRVVVVPVANVFFTPSDTCKKLHAPIIHRHDVDGLCTQALMGELLEVIEQKGDWLRVKLLEQTTYRTENLLVPIDGWILRAATMPVSDFPISSMVVSDHNVSVYQLPVVSSKQIVKLSCGTKLVAVPANKDWLQVYLPNGISGFIQDACVSRLPDASTVITEKDLRARLVNSAKSMTGTPFCWSARSSYAAYDKQQLTGLGCDGLVNLVYRACGIDIPRFVDDQYHCGEPIDGSQLQGGDLIFFASPKRTVPFKPHHAMMYLGDDILLEATYQSVPPLYPARIISCEKRLKRSVVHIKNGEIFNNGRYAVYFCRIIKSI